jgi:hypothetical protein
LLLEEGTACVLHGILGVDLQLGGDRLTLAFNASSNRGGLGQAVTLLDRCQTVVDGGELALDFVELLVEVSD